jgi:hypothetical protein
LNAELEAKTASLIKEAEDVLVQLLLQFQITCMLLLDFMHQEIQIYEFYFILFYFSKTKSNCSPNQLPWTTMKLMLGSWFGLFIDITNGG